MKGNKPESKEREKIGRRSIISTQLNDHLPSSSRRYYPSRPAPLVFSSHSQPLPAPSTSNPTTNTAGHPYSFSPLLLSLLSRSSLPRATFHPLPCTPIFFFTNSGSDVKPFHKTISHKKSTRLSPSPSSYPGPCVLRFR